MVNIITVSSSYTTGEKTANSRYHILSELQRNNRKRCSRVCVLYALCPFVMTLCMCENHLHVFLSRGLLFFHYQEEKKKKKKRRRE